MKKLFAPLIVLLIFIISPSYDLTAEEYIYVDLDGDGMDDNIGDKNNDGIPDFSKDVLPQSDKTEITGGTGIFSSMPMAQVDVSDITPKSKMFGQFSFCCRNLCTNRGGFTSSDGFGSENGLSGSSMGGVCVGPLCH